MLPQQNGDTQTRPVPKRQSPERRSADLLSKLKKAEKIMGSSLLESLKFSVFFKLPR